MSLTGVTTKSALLAKLETSAADYNGTFAEVSTKAKRSGGFVMTAGVSKAIAEGGTTSVALTLKRTVAKVAVQTSVDASFNSKYSDHRPGHTDARSHDLHPYAGPGSGIRQV